MYQQEVIDNTQDFNLADLHEKAYILAHSGKRKNIDDYEDEENQEDYNAFLKFVSTESDNVWEISFEENIVLK